ncbi:MAG TPA: hypothetical protein VGD40_17910 [Chryseosolibacter sp.]
MSITKILMVFAVIVVIVVIAIYYSLSPTVRIVSDEPALKPLVKKPLKLKSNASIFQAEQGQYIFKSNILSREGLYSQAPALSLAVGDEIVIHEFKTHRSNIGSGFTHLYALGEVRKDNQQIPFEYDLGTVDREFYTEPPTVLMTTLWQDPGDPKIELKR